MSDANRKVGGLLVGVGGITAAPALLSCIPRRFLVALGLGFILKDVLLLAIAAAGSLAALFGFCLGRKHEKGEGT